MHVDAAQLGALIRTVLTLAAIVWVASNMADDYFDRRRRR